MVAATSVDFSRLSIRQEHEIHVNTMIGHIETIRNYEMQGKGIGAALETPDSWRIDISEQGSGSVLTSYSGSTSGVYTRLPLNVGGDGFFIENVRCTNINETITETINVTDTWSLIFEDSVMSISGCVNTNLRILQFDVHYGDITTVEANTINGIIQAK